MKEKTSRKEVDRSAEARQITPVASRSQSIDVFLSAPMAALATEKAYREGRALALGVAQALRDCGFESVFYAGEQIERPAEFDCKNIAFNDIVRSLWDSRYFLMLYLPTSRMSSVLVEAGYALALGLPSIYFVLGKRKLPYLLDEAGQASPARIVIYRVKTYEDVLDKIRKHRKKLFETVALRPAQDQKLTCPTEIGANTPFARRDPVFFGDMERAFRKQEETAKTLLKVSPYERNVFVMMPFLQNKDDRFARLELIVRTELEKKGFRAWLSTDIELDSDLLDNITCYIAACKYGVAIFARKDDEQTGIIQREFNPNVSLELGYMLSRGKRVLILKDAALPNLHSDLMGKLYAPFDLSKPGSQLAGAIA
ncbi:MAG: TIR domain-containing protein, partial [Candidatus Brocadiia bacterium]